MSWRESEGLGSYVPPIHSGDLFLQLSVDYNRVRRNSRSAAAIFCASGVSRGIRPSGGSTISDVRAPTCLLDTKTAWLYARGTSNSVPRSAGLASPYSTDRCLSSSSRCASVKNSWLAYFGGRCKAVSNSSVQMPCRSGSPQGVFSATPTLPSPASGGG